MASYDLKCEDCGRAFEVFVQGFLKEGNKVCPDCGSLRVGQRFTGFVMGVSANSGPTTGGGGCASHGGFG